MERQDRFDFVSTSVRPIVRISSYMLHVNRFKTSTSTQQATMGAKVAHWLLRIYAVQGKEPVDTPGW